MRGLTLVGHVERVRDVQIILNGAAGALSRVLAIRHELGVGVQDRVGAEAGGQDVGVGHGDLEELTAELKVLSDQLLDGHVQGHTAGRADVLGDRREVERADLGRGQRLRGGRKGDSSDGRGLHAASSRSRDRSGDPGGRGTWSAGEDLTGAGREARALAARARRSGHRRGARTGRVTQTRRIAAWRRRHGRVDRRRLGVNPSL